MLGRPYFNIEIVLECSQRNDCGIVKQTPFCNTLERFESHSDMPTDNALHKAAHNGDKAACLAILEEGEIDVNCPGAGDRRPLHRAAGGNHSELCILFLDKGAIIDQPDKSGRTPLHWAAISGHKEATETLLNRGANINAVTTTGMTSLHGAVEGGKIEVVRLLMEKKADSTLKDAESKVAFDYAVAAKSNPICKLMKDMGDPSAQSASCTIQ